MATHKEIAYPSGARGRFTRKLDSPLHVGEPDACARVRRDTASGSPNAETLHGKGLSKDPASYLVPPAAEADFQQLVIDTAKQNRWAFYHTFRSDRSEA